MLFWPIGNQDEEGKVILLETKGNNGENFALYIRSIALIKAVDDDQTSG